MQASRRWGAATPGGGEARAARPRVTGNDTINRVRFARQQAVGSHYRDPPDRGPRRWDAGERRERVPVSVEVGIKAGAVGH